MNISNLDWFDFEGDLSLDLSFPRTFSDIFTAEIGEFLKDQMCELGEIWRLIGLPQNKREEQIDQMRKIICNQIKEFVQRGQEFLKECRDFNEFKMEEINQILSDLSLEKFSLPEGIHTLIAQNKILQQKYNEVMAIRNDRMEKLDRLESKLKIVCHKIGADYEPTQFATNIPSEMELKTLVLVLKNEEKVLMGRKTKFETMKQMINKLQQEIGYSPENDEEHMLLNSSKEEFIFSPTNMTKLMNFHKKLTERYEDYKMKIEKLCQTLEQLYNRLDIPKQERELFYKKLVGNFLHQEQCLDYEIAKYEIIKKNSLEKIIKNIRSEFQVLISKSRAILFDQDLLLSQDFTEELLNRLELEFENLNKFYESYQVIFDKLQEYEISIEKLIELEKKSTDPNRFNNRGGALLQIERDRKLLTKKIPRLEKEIPSLMESIYQNTGITFNSYGMNIDEFFENKRKPLTEFRIDLAKLSSTKSSTNSSKSSNNSSNSASTQKPRIPFSPRSNNLPNTTKAPLANGIKRNLEVDLKKASDPLEQNFQAYVQKDTLHSTMIDNENQIPAPTGFNLLTPTKHDRFGCLIRSNNRRRRSKSCEIGSGRKAKINRIEVKGSNSKIRPILEAVTKRPPFIP